MYRSAKLRTHCQGHPGTHYAACVYLAGDWTRERDGASERIGLYWTWDGELGCTWSRVSADPAKNMPEPSSSFNDSCPRIINNVGPCGYYSYSTDEKK